MVYCNYMKHLHLSVPHISTPALNKKLVLGVLGAVLIGLLLAVAAIHQVQAERDQKQAQQALQQRAAKAEADKQALINKQIAQLTAASAKGDQACAYIKSLATAKATARLVAVPAFCK